jgi:hypothetical protein
MNEESYPHFAEIFEMVLGMESMQFYPKTDKGVLSYVKAVHRIIQDQEKCPALESCRILIDRALDNCETFPPPVRLYDLYRECGFYPKDKGPVPEEFMLWKKK